MAEKRDEQNGAQRDLLHLLASLHWEQCHTWKKYPSQCAVLRDTVVILDRYALHISSTDLHSWTTTTPPYYGSSLTTYQSKFVLVGGFNPTTNIRTNQLWTSTTGLDWETSLPAMPTSRYRTSSVSGGSPEVLVVAGGSVSYGNQLDVVEVLCDDHWTTAASLPTPCENMSSTFHKGNFYFTEERDQENILYTCNYDSLINRTTTGPVWRKMTIPGDTRAIASYSSRLIRIDYYSIITSYSDNTQKWVEPISVGDAPPHSYSAYVCTAILSTGQLMIANDIGVYRITLSVSPFDPETSFISNVLSRLEAVMGIEIESVFATKWDTLTGISGVELQTRRNRREEIKLPDPQRDPVLYVGEVILQWSMGHSPRPPTWRELLQVMQDMGLLQLRQQIEAFMKGEAGYFEAYNHFVATKESLDLLFLKFLFVGPPRLGKTTLLRRLLKEIVDLITAGEADQSQPSTGAVESSDVVVTGVSSTTAIITESEWSKLAGLVEETRMLIHSLMSTFENTRLPRESSQLDDVARSDLSDRVDSTQYDTSQQSPPTTSETQQQLPVPVPLSGTSRRPQKANLPQHILEASTILREAMGSDHWKNIKHMFKAYMRMEDTGGQPELMDMLPALTLGPGLYLLFINLQNDLNHHYKLTYCNESGESTPPIESVYSVKEMLLSSLSSISCSNASFASASKPTISSANVKLESSKSVAYIVGTHKDKVSDEHVKKLNEDIKKIILPTEFYKNDIVQFASEEDLIIAMDNMAGGAEEVQKMKKLLEDTMARHFKTLKIPAVWLFLSLYLRHHDKRTASLDYCMQLSSTLGMSVHETEVALWFLHHHAGVLMYFPDVPEMKDLVIIDTQVVYDSVTKLIIQAMSYDKVGLYAANEFKKTGKFTKSRIISATRDISGDHIPIDQLIVLMEFLHIIARISSQSPPLSSSSQDEVTYMMPCVLQNANTEKLDSISKIPQNLPSMLFFFTCGAVPIGLFPALIAGLITTKSLKLIQNSVYKNLVKFRYGPLRTSVTLVCHSKFYELCVSAVTKKILLDRECDSIRKEIEAALAKVASRFNYGSLLDYKFAFDCPIHPDCNRQHLCVMDRDENIPQMMDCLENADDPIPVELSEHYQVWFGQNISLPLTTPETQISTEISNGDDTDFPLTLKELSLLKRKNKDGSIEKLRIIEAVGTKWMKMGDLMGISASRLTSIEKHRCGDVEECCREVFNSWLKKEIEEGYPVTWQGLCELLEDLQLSQLVEELKKYIST